MSGQVDFKSKISKDYIQNIKNLEKDLKDVEDDVQIIRKQIKENMLDIEKIDQDILQEYSVEAKERDYKRINALYNKKNLFNQQVIEFQKNLTSALTLRKQYRSEHNKLTIVIQKHAMDLEKNSDIQVSNQDIIESLKVLGQVIANSRNSGSDYMQLPEGKIIQEVQEELDDDLYDLK
jgi:septal ring factor EnvC (AmiA/AmiB activator)